MATWDLSCVICENCDIDNCKYLQNTIQILQEYQSWLYHEENKLQNTVTQLMDKLSISNKVILKYYNHIKENDYYISNDNLLCGH